MASERTESRRYLRAAGAACLAGVVATHLIDLPDKIAEATYMAVLFCLLIIAAAGLAVALLLDKLSPITWGLAGTLSAMTITGYVLSRSVGLPQLEDHVGKWLDPAGVASLLFEALLITISVRVLLSRRGPGRATGRPRGYGGQMRIGSGLT